MEVLERYALHDNESKIPKYCHRNVTIPAKTRAAASTMQVSTRKTSGESDLGGALQCGSRIETAREPTSLLLSVPVMVR
jgi:hypothetical protein